MIRNYTPHEITIYTDDGMLVLQPIEPTPRLTVKREPIGSVNTVPIYYTEMGEPENLPEPEEGIVFVVSALVALHPSCRERQDLFFPGEPIRNGQGQIIGCKGLTYPHSFLPWWV